MDNKPNVLFIMVDQMRGDCMGVAGHPDVKTPYLDSLAEKGIRFENAYSACPSCVPARASLLTGLSQEHTGRVGYKDGVDWDYPVTLAGELSKNGYHTECIGKMHVHPQRNLMGYQHIELHNGILEYYCSPDIKYCENQYVADDYLHEMAVKGYPGIVSNSGIEFNSWLSKPWMYEESLHPTNWVTDHSIDFLRRRDRSKPFFLTASYVRPHPPFDAPSSYFDIYNRMNLREPALGDWETNDSLEKRGRIFDSDTGPVDKEMVRQAQVGYYACISHVDHQIGRLINAFRAEGLLKNTIIIFTSDHGELLCDHHTYRKIRAYQGSVHIPFIVSGPENLVRKHRVSDTITELRDIMPTILDACGCAIPDTLDGKSLWGEISETGSKIQREYIHGEHTGPAEYANQYIVTKKDKYIWYTATGEEQYFNLEKDPFENHDGINDDIYKDRISYLRSLLVKELENREEGFVSDGKLVKGRKTSPVLSFLRK